MPLSHFEISLALEHGTGGRVPPPRETGGLTRQKKQKEMNSTAFNPQELCSRKLWQIVNTAADPEITETELREAVAELAQRRHYLEELAKIGKLEATRAGS